MRRPLLDTDRMDVQADSSSALHAGVQVCAEGVRSELVNWVILRSSAVSTAIADYSNCLDRQVS